MIKKYNLMYLIMAGVFFSLALMWRFYFAKFYTMRIPQDWNIQAEYLGELAYADKMGKFPNVRPLNVYKRNVYTTKWSSKEATIIDHYQILDIETGNIAWESKFKFLLDPVSGKNISYPNHPEASGLYYTFPQNTEKKDYRIFNYNLNEQIFKFDGIENINGIEFYVFKFKGDIDFTEVDSGTEDFPGIIPPSGQKIMSFGLLNKFWVEPITGEWVQVFEESSGDYFVNAVTMEKIAPLMIWNGESTNNTTEIFIKKAKNRLFELKLHRCWLPTIFLTLGLLCIFLVIAPRLRHLLDEKI